MNNTTTERSELLAKATQLAFGDHVTVRPLTEVTVKHEAPRKWWYVGKARYFEKTKGFNVGDKAGTTIVYDGRLVRRHWVVYNFGHIQIPSSAYSVPTELSSYTDEELTSLITKLS
jgi:hypothetical protein